MNRKINVIQDNGSIRTKKTVNGVDTEYFYVGDTLVSQKTGNEVINFAYTAGGAPYGFTYNGTSYFYLLNIQGDIIGIYDSNGNVVVEYTYDSWGKLISITGSLASTIGIKNPLRYRGYYYDTETSLYYLQSRYYDPETGRFINMDTYFIAGNDYIQGTNMYAYCYNNPIMYVDPTGYEVKNDASHPAILVTWLFSSWAIMYFELDMSLVEIATLTVEVGDIGDLVYVAEVMYNGKENGTYTDNPYIKGYQIEVCKAFTNKNVCLKVAEFYTGETLGYDELFIAQEIYAHAVAFYYSDAMLIGIENLKENDPYYYSDHPEFAIMEGAAQIFIDHSEAINLGGNGTFDKMGNYMFPFVWNLL